MIRKLNAARILIVGFLLLVAYGLGSPRVEAQDVYKRQA